MPLLARSLPTVVVGAGEIVNMGLFCCRGVHVMRRWGASSRIVRVARFVFFGLMICMAEASAAEPSPDIIVLFDQSGSMGRHDPRLASKAWLLTFIKTFTAPYKIALVGFDETVHEHLVVDTNGAEDGAALGRAVDAITTRGLATDLELPFRHLVERGQPSTKLALIISDGEPEIWDAKLGYLSQRVQSDTAYDGLNQRYRDQKDAGASQKELFEQLGHRYFARNIDLIESHLLPLSKTLGNKLIIWDLSGTSFYLRTWAKAAGAQYLPMKVAAHENPAEIMKQAMLDLQRKSSTLIDEALPADPEKRAEAALTAMPEIGPLSKSAPPSPPLPVPAPVSTPAPVSQPVAEEAPADYLPWLLLVLVIGAGAVYVIRRKAPAQETARPPLEPLLEPLPEKEVEASPDLAPDLDSAARFIAGKVQSTLDEAEALRRRLLLDKSEIGEQDRRFSLRVAVPAGAMNVTWIGSDGAEHSGRAINISMQGVRFEAPQFDAASIARIVCPKMDITLNVEHSAIVRQDEHHAVATVSRFGNNLDDWMQWVEIVNRIDQEAG